MDGIQETRNCPELAALLSRASANEGSEEVAQMLADHVARCVDCTAAETQLAALMARYTAAEASPLPDDLERRLLDMILNAHCGTGNA